MEKRTTKRLTQKSFIEKADIIHNNEYYYDKVVYTNNKNKVIITCPIHGDFKQTPHNHLKGSKCPVCSKNKRGFEKRKTIKTFIDEATEIHNHKYSYLKSVYTNANIKLIITCPIHGDFKQTPKAHITLKQGCPSCFNELRKHNAPSWTKENWVKAGKQSKIYDGFKLYIIECTNENETFIKVGRTYTKLYKRFTQIPYDCKIIRVVFSDDGNYIFELEKRFKRLFKKYKYCPLINFGGKHECFSIS